MPKIIKNTIWFDKVIAKIEGCNFLTHSVFLSSDTNWPARLVVSVSSSLLSNDVQQTSRVQHDDLSDRLS